MDIDIEKYKDPNSEVNVLKNKISIATRLKKTLIIDCQCGGKFKVKYIHPYWRVYKNDKKMSFQKDVAGVADYLLDIRLSGGVLLDTAEIIE